MKSPVSDGRKCKGADSMSGLVLFMMLASRVRARSACGWRVRYMRRDVTCGREELSAHTRVVLATGEDQTMRTKHLSSTA